MSARLRLQRRATARLRRWPKAIADDAIGYFQKIEARSATGSDPYWLELPRWLHKSPRFVGRGRVDSCFLSDVLWAQYCLFLFGRMSDDVFDGESAPPALMYLGDDLLIEAQRAFASHLPGGPFWPLFRKLVATSLHGVLEADALQRRPDGAARDYLTAYARMAAILKAGTAAMCIRYGRMADYPRLSAFVNNVAIAGQIVDDIVDVQADLARARFNFAASCLMAQGHAGPDPTAQIGHRIVFEDGLGAVVEKSGRHADRAAAAIRPLKIPEADAYMNEFRNSLQVLSGTLHRARVEYLFGAHLGA
jgi:hypothetical protein